MVMIGKENFLVKFWKQGVIRLPKFHQKIFFSNHHHIMSHARPLPCPHCLL